MAELILRRGYARQTAQEQCLEAWREAAGPKFGPHTRPGLVRRGVLEVLVVHSMLAQELSFQKGAILARLTQLVPELRIRDLRFRVGPIAADE